MKKNIGALASGLGFRGLFMLIGLLSAAAFLAVAVPHLLLRWSAMQAAEARLAAISRGQPVRGLLGELRQQRRQLFLAGAGDGAAQAALAGKSPFPVPAGLAEGARLQALFAMTPAETAGRRRLQVFGEFGELVAGLQQVQAAYFDVAGGTLGSGAAATLNSVWLEDLPLLAEMLSRLEVLAGVSVREGAVPERLRPELSASVAVAAHALGNVRKHLALMPNEKAASELLSALAALENDFAITDTLANGLALSNTAYSQAEVERAAAQPLAATAELSRLAEMALTAALADDLALARQHLLVTLCLVVGSLLLSGGGLLTAYARLARNIDTLARGAGQLATGDLSVSIELDGHDELQRIARSLREVRDGMRRLVGEIINSAHALTSGSLAFAQTAAASAGRAKQQEEDTRRVVSAVESVGLQVGEIVEAAGETDLVARNSDQLASSGMASVSQAKRVLDGMSADIFQATVCLERMETETKQVSTVVAVIAGIAEQTNLLALNAAIEAARAGESGRGFAVVADEVRKLAERTALSTREIGQMIDRMQGIAGETAAAVRTAASHVENSNRQAGEAEAAMCRVRDQARLVESASARISKALGAHREETGRIEQLVGGIAVLSAENGVSLGRASDSAHQLEALANELRAATGKFRLSALPA